MNARSDEEVLLTRQVRLHQCELLHVEFEALLEVLRRDLRLQQLQMHSNDPDKRQLSRQWMRVDIRLLEALNPKRGHREHILSTSAQTEVARAFNLQPR